MQRSVSRVVFFGLALSAFACGGTSESQEATNEAPKTEEAKPAAAEKAAAAPDAAEMSASNMYKQRAERLVLAIDAGADAAKIVKMADGLTKAGLGMLPAMVEAHPACEGYLDAIAKAGPTLKDLPLEEIEKGYHEDGKLPEMPSAECYHGKDLVVHPATVAALGKAGLATPEDRAQAKAEIVEVLSHLGALDASEK